MADKLKLRESQPLEHDQKALLKLCQKALLLALREKSHLDDHTLRYALKLSDK